MSEPRMKTGDWIIERHPAEDKPAVYKVLFAGTNRERTIIASNIYTTIKNRFRDVETGKESLEIVYADRGHAESSVVVPADVKASTQKLAGLAEHCATLVSADTAKDLARFYDDLLRQNAAPGEALAVKPMTHRFGWLSDAAGKPMRDNDGRRIFAPYCDILVNDPCADPREVRKKLNTFTPAGNIEEWRASIYPLRNSSAIIRIVLAAAFASALTELLHTEPYMVYLWGRSGFGKTVLLRLLGSVWGNPSKGAEYLLTMNATDAAKASHASTLHDIPLLLDEVQAVSADDRRRGFEHFIMGFCEGKNRARSNVKGHMISTTDWNCAVIATGEEPILKSSDGNGTQNRVIELHIDQELFESTAIAALCRMFYKNYAVAGRCFIRHVQTLNVDELRNRLETLRVSFLNETQATEKHALIAAQLLLADELARGSVFTGTNIPLSCDDLRPFVKTNAQIDKSAQAWEACRAIIQRNEQRFIDIHGTPQNSGDLWGKFDGTEKKVESVFVLSRTLNDELEKAGYTFHDEIKADWVRRGWLVRKDNRSFTVQKWYKGSNHKCYMLNWAEEP